VVNPQELYKIGDKIKAKVIAIDNDKLSLSIKQLSEDPWLNEAKKLKVGQAVSGTITRLTPFGAFVQITPAVEALLHISEVSSEKELEKQYQAGKNYDFKLLEIDEQARKITLTTDSAKTKKAKPKSKSK
jgi:ribosomal protein S1